MNKKILLSSIFALSLGLFAFSQHNHVLCEGIVEENDLYIPVSEFHTMGISEAQFNAVIDELDAFYRPIIASLGGRLDIRRRWSDGTVNASAMRSGSTYVVNMYGGLARHETITSDGFALVVCHELGHHIGGSPKMGSGFSSWASNEGQADYFATLKCLRHVFKDQDNADFVSSNEIDPFLMDSCQSQYNTTEEENLCIRLGMAGASVANLFGALRREGAPPRFNTPDANKVSRTSDAHPGTQCRMDTYFNGALCTEDHQTDVDQQNPETGTCYTRGQFEIGTRPQCWFKPS